MKVVLKNGVIAGVAGLAVGGCASLAISPICAPIVAILVGALAGRFTGRESPDAGGRSRAWRGALAGAIAGVFVLLARLVIGLSRLSELARFAQQNMPANLTTESDQTLFMATAVITAFSLFLLSGLVDVLAATLAGAAAAYLAHPAAAQPSATNPALPGVRARGTVWGLSLRVGLVVAGLMSVVPFAVWMYGGASFGDFVQLVIIGVVVYGGGATLVAAVVISAARKLFSR